MRDTISRLSIIFLIALLASTTFGQSGTTNKAPNMPGVVEFYLTGDEYSGVVSIGEFAVSGTASLGVIGGMRSHSLRVNANPGNHLYVVAMADDKNGQRAQIVVESGMLHKVRIDLHAVKSESSGLRTIT